MMETKKEIGEWVQEMQLGCGGFGFVILWKNKKTGKRLAIKHCRLGSNDQVLLSEKQKERWRTEVKIMQKLSHPNVVTAIQVPEELNDPTSSMPMMAMEYCSRGDLRKVLKNPLNCCGLQEIEVKTLIANISSAVKYLHSVRIIHRDLKPENIVLQENEGKTVYKLIDLGYAKNVEQNSICSSFVGTVQYLAPELFLSEKYNSTVDYWSLGLVAHECITGVRPFLPKKPPAQWMPLVCKKGSNDICVYEADDGKIIYSEKLFKENHLNRLLLEDLEDWLKLLLEWKPEKRGTREKNSEKEIIAFSALEEILAKKIVHIFYVGDGNSYVFHIDENTSMETLLSNISKEIKISENELEFLLPRGVPPEMSKTALQCWNPDDEWILFVYPKNFNLDNKIEDTNVPSAVTKMIAEKTSKLNYEEQHRMWCHAVYFLQKEAIRDKHFQQAQKILLQNLLFLNGNLKNFTSEVIKQMVQLQAKLEFFKESLDIDKMYYQKQTESNGLTSSMLKNSLNCEEIIQKIAKMQIDISEIENHATEINMKTTHILQRIQHPYKFNACSTSMWGTLDNIIDSGCELLESLRQKSKEDKNKQSDNGPMLSLLVDYLKKKSESQKRCFTQMKQINGIRKDTFSGLNNLPLKKKSLEQLSKELFDLQRNRQDVIWQALTRVVEKLLKSRTEDSFGLNGPSSSLDSQTSSFLLSSMNSAGAMSLSSILNKSSEESLNIIQENRDMISRLEEVTKSLPLPELQKLDWDSLN